MKNIITTHYLYLIVISIQIIQSVDIYISTLYPKNNLHECLFKIEDFGVKQLYLEIKNHILIKNQQNKISPALLKCYGEVLNVNTSETSNIYKTHQDSIQIKNINKVSNHCREGTTIGILCGDTITLTLFFQQDSIYYWYDYSKEIFRVTSYDLYVSASDTSFIFFNNNIGAIIPDTIKSIIASMNNIQCIIIEGVRIRPRNGENSQTYFGISKKYHIVNY